MDVNGLMVNGYQITNHSFLLEFWLKDMTSFPYLFWTSKNFEQRLGFHRKPQPYIRVLASTKPHNETAHT